MAMVTIAAHAVAADESGARCTAPGSYLGQAPMVNQLRFPNEPAEAAWSRPHISLVVPTYNERENLPPLLARICRALDSCPYEVVVVDDNSPDGTAAVASELCDKYPIRLIRRAGARGLASAVVRGFKQASGDYLAVMDADLQHPPETLPSLLRCVENGADIAVASRYTSGSSLGDWGIGRRAMSLGASLAARLVVPSARGMNDPMSGFFVLKRSVVEGIQLNPVGYKILLEILAEAKDIHVEEVPYDFERRREGASKLKLREHIDYLRHLFTLACRLQGTGRFIRFCLVGLSGVGLTLTSMWLFTSVLGLFYVASAVITSFLAITSNFIWNDLWTFRDRRRRGLRNLVARWAGFAMARSLLFLLGLALLPLFVQVAGLHYLPATVMIIGIQTVFSYGVSILWIWRKRDVERG
jgi:dolichol-phosphate mannosyltransferase